MTNFLASAAEFESIFLLEKRNQQVRKLLTTNLASNLLVVGILICWTTDILHLLEFTKII